MHYKLAHSMPHVLALAICVLFYHLNYYGATADVHCALYAGHQLTACAKYYPNFSYVCAMHRQKLCLCGTAVHW